MSNTGADVDPAAELIADTARALRAVGVWLETVRATRARAGGDAARTARSSGSPGHGEHGGARPSGHTADTDPDPELIRDGLAARWAAAEAVRDDDPEAAQAWGTKLREAGVDTDRIRDVAEQSEPVGTADPEADRIEQMAMDFAAADWEQRWHDATATSTDPTEVGEGTDIGDAIGAATHATGTAQPAAGFDIDSSSGGLIAELESAVGVGQ